MQKNLILFTEQYPVTKLETFIEQEVLMLEKQFENIYFVPLGNAKLSVFLKNKNNQLQNLSFGKTPRIRQILKTEFKLILAILKTEKKEGKNFKKYIYSPIKSFKEILFAIRTAYLLQTILPKNAILYSYWYGHWSLTIAIYKQRFASTSYWLTKMHGYDVDPQQVHNGFYPFRMFNNQFLNRAVTISNYGNRLFKQNNPNFSGQINTHYLGTNNNQLAPIPNSANFTIVSCSKVINLKRLPILIEILGHLNRKIIWVHFGDGEALNDTLLKAKNLPPNIGYEFKGKVKNEDILEYYKTNEIDLFINTSLLEGLPYSMIEAASFGIPLAGYNVCGIPEILDKKMGVMLDTNLNAAENADKIKSFLIAKLSRDLTYRTHIQQTINDKFNAVTNYNNFILKELQNT